MTRLDRHALIAIATPLPGSLAGITAIALLLGVRRLLERAPGAVDHGTVSTVLFDVALSALPVTLPLALGSSTALAGARLSAEADLAALASAGVGPVRRLAAPCGLAVAVAAASWPIGHHVAPAALARIGPAVLDGRLDGLERRVAAGVPSGLDAGPAGAVYVVGPGRVGWLNPRGEGGVADLHGLARSSGGLAASLGPGVAWLDAGSQPIRVTFESARVALGETSPHVSPWDRRPGRAWSSPRLRARAREASTPVERRARWRRLAAERDALPALVLGYFMWAAGATWRARRAASPILTVAAAIAVHHVVGRVAAGLAEPAFAAAAALAAPLALVAGGVALIAREELRA